jgi:hypothetical protein
MAAITSGEKTALDSVRLIFGKNSRDVREFFESLGIQAVLNCAKGEKITIPFIGELEVAYDGDEITGKGRTARLKTSFTPSPFLVRNIGQMQDGESTDAEKILLNRFQAVFRERIGE